MRVLLSSVERIPLTGGVFGLFQGWRMKEGARYSSFCHLLRLPWLKMFNMSKCHILGCNSLSPIISSCPILVLLTFIGESRVWYAGMPLFFFSPSLFLFITNSSTLFFLFCFVLFSLLFKRFYVFIHERSRDIGRGEAGSLQGVWCGTRSQDPRITLSWRQMLNHWAAQASHEFLNFDDTLALCSLLAQLLPTPWFICRSLSPAKYWPLLC